MIQKFIVSVVTLLVTGYASADGFTVSGEAKHAGEGIILLELLSEEQFNNGENSEYGIAVTPDEGSDNKVSFAFENVPAGEYLLQGFQDTNGNGDLDEGSFGPTEPWVIHGYKPSAFSGPKFSKSKITVDGDMTDIKIHLKK